MRVGKLALIVPVMTSTRGALRRHDDVDAGGARHLRETLHGGFDFLAGRDHQIGHLVDDDDDVGHRLERQLARFVDRLAGGGVEARMHGALEALAALQRVADAIVVAGDVAHAELGHAAIAILHLAHGPFERDDGFLRIGDDRVQQVRDALVDAELQHLRVDHDEAALVRRVAVEQRQDHGVDADRLARAGGAGDEQVRHLGEVGGEGVAFDGLAERERQIALHAGEARRVQQRAQEHGFALAVRQLDADGVAAGNDGDARGGGVHGARDVVG